MVVVLEAARRTTGWILPISAVAFLAYAFAGPLLASIGLGGIAHRGYDLPRLVGNLYMTLEGMYGVPLDVAVTYIVLFSLYGAVLETLRRRDDSFSISRCRFVVAAAQSGAQRPAGRSRSPGSCSARCPGAASRRR